MNRLHLGHIHIMTTERTKLGLAAEDIACKYLQGQGFQVMDRNWRRPWGELDIVARQNDTIHFIEVKASARQVSGFEPFLRADRRKMHKVQRTAQTWLTWHRYGPDTEWQLDIISVIMDPTLDTPLIEYFPQIT
jgi:putative endonuclease